MSGYYERPGGVPRGPAFGYLPPDKMPHIGHQKHLCYLAESGESTLEEVKALVKDAKFVCKVCGRAAATEENLCEPVPL